MVRSTTSTAKTHVTTLHEIV